MVCSEQLRLRVVQPETPAVVFAGADAVQGFAVVFGGVAFVDGPVVRGVRIVQACHPFVAVGLGEDAGGGDAAETTVTFHEARVWYAGVGDEAVTVDQQVLRRGAELCDGAMHGDERGAEDVERVDLRRFHGHHGPSQRTRFDQRTQGFAFCGGEFLAVVQTGDACAGRQDHRCGHHRTGQAATARLVAAGFEQAFGVVGGEGHTARKVEGRWSLTVGGMKRWGVRAASVSPVTNFESRQSAYITT